MFELKVGGIFEAGRFIEGKWPTRIVSLVDPKVNMPSAGDHHFIAKMHDVESQVMPHWILPSKEHIQEILNFTKDLTDTDKLLVHCHMGVSRSTATAIGICIQHSMNFKEAYEHVFSVRDCLMPNRLIVKHLDEIFNLGGEFYNFITEKRTKDMQRRADQIIDEANPANRTANVDAMKDILIKLKGL